MKKKEPPNNWYKIEKGNHHTVDYPHMTKRIYKYLQGDGVKRSLDRLFGNDGDVKTTWTNKW